MINICFDNLIFHSLTLWCNVDGKKVTAIRKGDPFSSEEQVQTVLMDLFGL